MKALAICLVAFLCVLVGAQYDYSGALSKSVLFFEAQRSGKLSANNRIPWRGDAFVVDGSDKGLDLSGGYHDAGDHVKFGLPFGHAMIFLAWGLIDYRAGYQAAGELDNGLASIRWGADYILKASSQIGQGILYGQNGNGDADHSYWGRPEEQTQNRPSYFVSTTAPGSDLAGNYAAALALTSVAIGGSDAAYSAQLLTVARQLYSFAFNNRGKYSNSMPEAAAFYNSYDYNDELTFAAAALALATDEQTYKTDAATLYATNGYANLVQEFFDWDNKHQGINVILARVLGDAQYKTATQAICDKWINGVPRTPKGLVFINAWGSLRHAANAAFGCLLAADTGVGNAASYRAFAKQQIDYMLGSTGRSYVVGFGVNPPQRPHHRSASCQNPAPAPCDWNDYNSPNPNGNVLNGALVGGPDQNDNYSDDRGNFQTNEVAIDYNAGFQSALAGLIQAGLLNQL